MPKYLLLSLLSLFFCTADAQQAPHLVIPSGHSTYVTGALITSNGKYIVTVAKNDEAIVWDAHQAKQLTAFIPDAHDRKNDATSSIILSKDEHQVIIFNNDYAPLGGVGPVVLTFPELKKITDLADGVSWVGYNPDGKTIDALDDFGGLRIYDAQSLKLLRSFDLYQLPYTSSNFGIPDIKQMTNDPTVKELARKGDTAQLKKLIMQKMTQDASTYQSKYGQITSAHFNTDGKLLVVSRDNAPVIIWNVTTGKKKILTGHTKRVNSAMFSQDNKLVVTASDDKTVRVWDVITGNQRLLIEHPYGVNTAAFVQNDESIITFPGEPDGYAGLPYPLLFNAETGAKLEQLEQANGNPIIFSPDRRYFVAVGFNSGMVFNAVTLRPELSGSFVSAQFTAGNKYLLLASQDRIRLYDAKDLKEVNNFIAYDVDHEQSLEKVGNSNIGYRDYSNPNISVEAPQQTVFGTRKDSTNYSANNRYSYESKRNGELFETQLIDHKNGKVLYTDKRSEIDLIVPYTFSPDSKYAAIPAYDKKQIKIMSLENGQIVNTLKGVFPISYMTPSYFTPDSKNILILDGNSGKSSVQKAAINFGTIKSLAEAAKLNRKDTPQGPQIINFITGKQKTRLEHDCGMAFTFYFSPPTSSDRAGGQYILTSGIALSNTYQPGYEIWNAMTGKLIASVTDNEEPITGISFSPDARYLFTTNARNVFKQWDLATGKFLATFIPGENGAVFQMTPDGYYQGDKNAVRNVYYVTSDLKIISSEQLDVKYNRPDKVQEAINPTDSVLKSKLQKAYNTRLQALHTNSNKVENEKNRPVAEILNEEFTSKTRDFKLHIKAQSPQPLQKLDIWVNRVPVYGLKGHNIKKGSRKQLDTTINIVLTYDRDVKNIIETSVTNTANIESYRAEFTVKCEGELTSTSTKPGFYFVGIGVDKFSDPNQNLSYSADDIRSLIKFFKLPYGPDAVIDTLINGQVTDKNLMALKARLDKNVGVDTRLVVVYSGHGINDGRNLYFPTANTNFNTPSVGSIPYKHFESLMDVPSRYKLMLIDACNSGDYDHKIDLRGNDRSKMIAKNSYELMRDLFVNVEKSTGATIIASSGKSSPSISLLDSLKHGILIYSVLEALNNSKPYFDFTVQRPGEQAKPWLVNTLKEYINKRVPELSDHTQLPIVRTENIEFDWAFRRY